MAIDKGNKGYLTGIVMVAVLGGLLFGYDTAVISVAGILHRFEGFRIYRFHARHHIVKCAHRLYHRLGIVGLDGILMGT